MMTIEETYRLVDMNDRTRERGLIVLQTTMTEGRPLDSHSMEVLTLGDEGLPAGQYRLEFVKRLRNPDLYRRLARSFNQLVSVNDRGPQ